MWGNNGNGQLGDNTTVSKSSPIQTITGGNDWKQVAAGYNSTFAIKNDGTLWACGHNGVGTLGDGTTVNKSSFVQIPGTWKHVSANYHVIGIREDGTLWNWGYNASGALGDGTLTSRSSPVQVITGGLWKTASVSMWHSAAIKEDGTLWTWGYGEHGALGTSDWTQRSSPVQTVVGGYDWKSVEARSRGTFAIKLDGSLGMCGSESLVGYGPSGATATMSNSKVTGYPNSSEFHSISQRVKKVAMGGDFAIVLLEASGNW